MAQRADGFNASKLARVLGALSRVLWIITLTLSALILFLAYQWHQAASHETTYFVTPQATYPAHRSAQTTNLIEIKNFTHTFLDHAFAHSEFTYKQKLNEALEVMDRKSGLYLKSKFNQEDIFALYKHYNGVSTLALEDLQINMKRYPYEVAAYYKTTLHFVGLEEEAKTVLGGVYFQLSEVPRSLENPYGLMIHDFEFIAYDKKK